MRWFISFLLTSIPWAVAQSTPILVVGVETGIDQKTWKRPARLEINDLYVRGGPQWDLYIQALDRMQQTDESNEQSYFAIAGIHGLPFTAWNGVGQVDGGGKSVGYCPHMQLNFGTWHRPYMALFEQVLVSHAQEIAKNYPDSQAPAYQGAAQTLRVPYWDWASNTSLPTVVTLPTIQVNSPSGPTMMRNPLYSYRFQNMPLGGNFGGPLSSFNETKRCPSEITFINNATVANAELASSDFKADIYNVFTQARDFETMTTGSLPGPNFEIPHNIVHNSAGCNNGTMYDVSWSAFDPLFMLHHVNVDRLMAMWQAVYYNDSMFTSNGSSNALFGTAAGTLITPDTPLKPFYDKDLRLYTSRGVASTRTFGYTYPEIDDWAGTPDDVASRVTVRINQLYAPKQQPVGSASGGGEHSRRSIVRRASGFPSSLKYYTAEIQVDRSEVPLPCTVRLVLNNKTVGTMALLGMPRQGTAYGYIQLQHLVEREMQRDMDAVEIEGQSSLDSGDGDGGLKAMTTDVVIPWLQKRVRVEIRDRDGNLVQLTGVPSLNVSLQDQDYTPRLGDASFPKYGAVTKWPIHTGSASIRCRCEWGLGVRHWAGCSRCEGARSGRTTTQG